MERKSVKKTKKIAKSKARSKKVETIKSAKGKIVKKPIIKKSQTKKSRPKKKKVITKSQLLQKKADNSEPFNELEKKPNRKIFTAPVQKQVVNRTSFYDMDKKSSPKSENIRLWTNDRVFLVVLLISVAIVTWWVYMQTPRAIPLMNETGSEKPVIDESATYYKYEIPEDQWKSFDGQAFLNEMIANGLRFEEAIYQTGSNTCQSCPYLASPIVYVKNPSQYLGAPWIKVNKPGFYENNDNFQIYTYDLQY